jgi:hypothetical protein
MKLVRTAAQIVGAVAAVAAVATGFGAPLGAGILGASFSTIATAAALVTTATTIAIGKPKQSIAGSPTQFKIDLQAPIPIMIGRTLNAGYIVHRESYGTKNAYQSFVAVISGAGPIDAIEAFQVDRTTITFTGGAADGFYSSWMWLDTQLGATPEADALTPPAEAGAMPAWDANSKLSGYAAFLWTLKFDTKGKKYSAGVPQPGVIARGVKVYDPRLDSTYPGGTGAHRSDDETTWEYSANPWLHALAWTIGRHHNGKRVAGAGVPIDAIDVAAFVEAANVADTNSWVAGGVVDTSPGQKWNNLKLMAQAGGGEPVRIGALVSCTVNAPKVSLDTITYSDIVGEAVVPATQSRRDRINGIVPKYRSEDHGWEVVPADVVSVGTYVTEDGGERTREVDYPLVQDVDQAAQLAAYDIVNAREFGPISLPLKTRWIGYKPGDCVTINVPELNLVSQTAIVIGRALDPQSGVVTLTLKSETAAKHAFALGVTGTAPPTPDLSVPDLSDVDAPGGGAWTLAGTALAGDGSTLPVLVFEGAVDDPNAEAVLFEYYAGTAAPIDEDDWISADLAGVNVTHREIASVMAGTSYVGAVSYRVNGVIGNRLVLGPVVTGIASTGGGRVLLESGDRILLETGDQRLLEA